jgi:LPS sulfotransferase NodH
MPVIKGPVHVNTDKSRYDLSTREADYPAWNRGKPLQTYILCSHTRSGSTLLSEAMYQAGGMGCPVEYFHLGFQPTMAKMWEAEDQASYIREAYRHRTDPTGAFGTKIFWMDVIDLCLDRHPEEAESINAELESCPDVAEKVYGLVKSIFEQMFPNPRYIFLTRRDRLRHAVSSLISGQVKIFRDISGAKRPAPAGEPAYDYDAILNRIRYYAYCDSRWNEFFRFARIDPYRIAYEDLSDDYEGAVKNLLVAMGKYDADKEINSPRLKRQANRLSEEFALRFLKEHTLRSRETQSPLPA